MLLMGLFRDEHIFEWSPFYSLDECNIKEESRNLSLCFPENQPLARECGWFYAWHSIPLTIHFVYSELAIVYRYKQIEYDEFEREVKTFLRPESLEQEL